MNHGEHGGMQEEQQLSEDDRVRLMELRKAIAIAEKQIENGEVTHYSRGEFAKIIVAEDNRILASRGKLQMQEN